jgi:hypothetical protein
MNINKVEIIMDKKSYFASVQSKTVSETADDTIHQFEILANSAEISELKTLFDSESSVDEIALVSMPITAFSSHPEESNQEYDSYLIRIFNKLYELGTLKTREHISEMNILIANEDGVDESQN